MTKVLTTRCRIQCDRCPQVLMFIASVPTLSTAHAPILLEPDLTRALIVGCPQVSPGQKPCTGVASVLRGIEEAVRVRGQKTVNSDVQVLSNGVPPARFAYRSDACALVERTDSQSWLELEVKDTEGNPLANEQVEVTLPDGSVRSGTLDSNGRLRLDGVPTGAVATVRFPGL